MATIAQSVNVIAPLMATPRGFRACVVPKLDASAAVDEDGWMNVAAVDSDEEHTLSTKLGGIKAGTEFKSSPLAERDTAPLTPIPRIAKRLVAVR
ncbi:hypothetical protein ACJZ2D_016263 [Fusarium nematophilum]